MPFSSRLLAVPILLLQAACALTPGTHAEAPLESAFEGERVTVYESRLRQRYVAAAATSDGTRASIYLEAADASACLAMQVAQYPAAEDVRRLATVLRSAISALEDALSKGRPADAEETRRILGLYFDAARTYSSALQVVGYIEGMERRVHRALTAIQLDVVRKVARQADVPDLAGAADRWADWMAVEELSLSATTYPARLFTLDGTPLKWSESAEDAFRKTREAARNLHAELGRLHAETGRTVGRCKRGKDRLTVAPAAIYASAADAKFNVIVRGGSPPYKASWIGVDPGVPLVCEDCSTTVATSGSVAFRAVAGMPPGVYRIAVTDSAGASDVVDVSVLPMTEASLARRSTSSIQQPMPAGKRDPEKLSLHELSAVVRQTGAEVPLVAYLQGVEAVNELIAVYGKSSFFKRDVELLKRSQLIACPDAGATLCKITDLGRDLAAYMAESRR